MLPATTPVSRPRVLLSTFPGEPHGMGLLMAEAVLRLDGCHCVSLGTQTPLWDIALAAQANRADVVGLSFTGCMNPNHIVDGLAELRSKLPADTPLWVGGSAPVLHRRRLEGVTPFGTLESVPGEVQRWRMIHAGVRESILPMLFGPNTGPDTMPVAQSHEVR